MIDLLKAELLRFRWWAAGCVAPARVSLVHVIDPPACIDTTNVDFGRALVEPPCSER